jgi:hypothetical protein
VEMRPEEFLGRTYCEEKKRLNCILMDGITVFQAVVCVKVADKERESKKFGV